MTAALSPLDSLVTNAYGCYRSAGSAEPLQTVLSLHGWRVVVISSEDEAGDGATDGVGADINGGRFRIAGRVTGATGGCANWP